MKTEKKPQFDNVPIFVLVWLFVICDAISVGLVFLCVSYVTPSINRHAHRACTIPNESVSLFQNCTMRNSFTDGNYMLQATNNGLSIESFVQWKHIARRSCRILSLKNKGWRRIRKQKRTETNSGHRIKTVTNNCQSNCFLSFPISSCFASIDNRAM